MLSCYQTKGVCHVGYSIQEQDKVIRLSQGSFIYLHQVKETGFTSKALSSEGKLSHCLYTLSGQLQIDLVPLKLILFIGSLQNTVLHYNI